MQLNCCAQKIAIILQCINAPATIFGIVLIIAGIFSLLQLDAYCIGVTLTILGVTTIVPGFFGFLGAYCRSSCQLRLYYAWLIVLALPKAGIAYLIMADNKPTIDVLARAFKLTEGDDEWTIKIRNILEILWKAIVDNVPYLHLTGWGHTNVPDDHTVVDPKYVSMVISLGYFCISMVSLELFLVACTWTLICFIRQAKNRESEGDSFVYDSFEMKQSASATKQNNMHVMSLRD